MKKVVLIDGNNLLFRSYFATAYTGNIMTNSKGFPTNALYGFTLMMNKIITEENPEYLMVAFDIGKNFRKEKYDFYKEGRSATPEELKMQMPIAREILNAMGIKYLEMTPYEADDIIGTVASYTEKDPEYSSLIVSSDRDLLQLISSETEMKLLKQSGFIRYTNDSFKKEYGIDPIKIIDLKSLMGDSSDNIPGVKGIGEKTALKLLQDYGSLDNIYKNIDNIKGKLKEKLEVDKDNAYMSYELATIYREVPLDVSFEEFKYNGPNVLKLKEIYESLEFYSFLKNMVIKDNKGKDNSYIKIDNKDDLDKIKLDKKVSLYLEVDNMNYHTSNILSISITDKDNTYIINKDLVNSVVDLLKDKEVITYDLKKLQVILKTKINCNLDLMVISYLIDMPANPDIYLLMNSFGISCISYEALKKNKFENLDEEMAKKSKFIYEYSDELEGKLKEDNYLKIYNEIERPLIDVLTDMEINGFRFENDKLKELTSEVEDRLNTLENEIYNLSNTTFNISSPKQLAHVLFDIMDIDHDHKLKNQKTDNKTLQNYIDDEPIIEKVLEYRNVKKLYTTYLLTLKDYVLSDGKIHTIFNQTLTRTGRLSSSEPNLQNIPVKEELGRKIRYAFTPEYDYILSADYSQIELRLLAHISGSKELIEAFNNGEDIHTKVASDIYGVKESEVSKHMRSTAKAVIFGIVYGISGFGLGTNLHISKYEASNFIKKYYELYPGVKKYMDDIVSEAYKTGEVRTMFGRVRKLNELKDSSYMVRSSGERMALNTPIQGSSADIMKLAMIEVYKKIKENKLQSKMILQIHDEILIDCKKEEIDKLKELVKESMENIVKLSVPLKVEINVGTNWFEAK